MTVPIKLFILGLLARKECHGYEIGAHAKSRGVAEWAGFGAGSLYHALSALEKTGDIKRKRTEQKGNYPSRAIYGITKQGRDNLGKLLVQASQDANFEDAIDLVLGFLPLVPAADRKPLLELRLDLLTGATRELAAKAAALRERGAAPWTVASLERWVAMGQAQAAWLRGLLDDVGSW
jgi:DNA-binding PadR family transcriptional regulator